MASARRVEQVNVLIREVIALLIARDISFDENILVTVTRVEVSEDLFYAKVLVSVFGSGADAEANALAELIKKTGLIQHGLNRKLRMRPVPRITFAIDKDEKRRERIEKLLSEGEVMPD